MLWLIKIQCLVACMVFQTPPGVIIEHSWAWSQNRQQQQAILLHQRKKKVPGMSWARELLCVTGREENLLIKKKQGPMRKKQVAWLLLMGLETLRGSRLVRKKSRRSF